MIFKNWKPWDLYEYAKDKILVTTMSNVLFIVHEFSYVKFINNQSYDDSFKGEPIPLLDFDEETFPFIIIGGVSCISIINIKTGEHKPLINQCAFNY